MHFWNDWNLIFFLLFQTRRSSYKCNLHCFIHFYRTLLFSKFCFCLKFYLCLPKQRSALLRFKHTNPSINNYFAFLVRRKHDAGMFTDSTLLDQLQLFANSPLGDSFYLYGDPAYPLKIHLQAPFRARALTPLMMDFSKSMSTVRESVEWLFNDIATYFKFIDFKKNMKLVWVV